MRERDETSCSHIGTNDASRVKRADRMFSELLSGEDRTSFVESGEFWRWREG